MSTPPISLVSRAVAKIALVLDVQEPFLDANGNFIGQRALPRKRQVQGMVDAVQGLPVDVPCQLYNPDGTVFNATGATLVRLSLFSTAPVPAALGVITGIWSGLPIDGLAFFAVPAINFVGFAEGEVEVTIGGRIFPFQKPQFRYNIRRST